MVRCNGRSDVRQANAGIDDRCFGQLGAAQSQARRKADHTRSSGPSDSGNCARARPHRRFPQPTRLRRHRRYRLRSLDRRDPQDGRAMKPSAVALKNPDLLARFAAIVGDKYAITDPQAQLPYLTEMRDMYRGRTPMVLRPGSVAEVSQILALANDTGTPIAPQGGHT